MLKPHTQFLKLKGGRSLCYCEYGDPGGAPVFYFHGFPSSRLDMVFASEAVRKRRIRLIAVDRPGFGQSDFQPSRRISDFPQDIAALADHLGIERFSLLAISGGGPCAIACAERLPDRVERLHLVCALGSYEPQGSTKGMRWLLSSIIILMGILPTAGHWFFRYIGGPILGAFPKLIIALYANQLSPPERKAFRDKAFRNNFLHAMKEAFRQGSAGVAWELCLITQPWEVDPANIRAETWIWHGDADCVVPVSHGRRHGELIPNCHVNILAREGHFSLIYNHMEGVLDNIAG